MLLLLLSASTLFSAATAATVPLPVTGGLQLWLAADYINPNDPAQVSVVGGVSYLKSWKDLSPNLGAASQTTATKQPIYVGNAAFGRPVVKFDGIDDVLVSTTPQVVGNKSIFIVHKRINLSTPSGTELSSSSASTGFFFGNNGGAESQGRIGVAHDAQLPGLANDYVLKASIRNGSTSTFYVNDASVTTTAPDKASGTYTISDANSFPFSGAVAEVLIYNRAVSEVERQSIENYLCEKWGLWNSSLPVRNGLELWLASDAINFNDPTHVVYRNGLFYLAKWPGRSVAGRSAYQTVLAKQPQVILGGVNNRMTVRFDGVDDFLSTSFTHLAGDKSIFTVMKRNGTANGLEVSSTSNGTNMFLGNNGAISEGKGRFSDKRTTRVFDLQVPLLTDQWVMKRWVRSGTAEKLQVNDAIASANVSYDFANGYYTISDSINQPFKGDVAEVLIYNRAVSELESTNILNYLQTKYSWTPDNVYSVAPDLQPPAMTVAAPAPGTRVKQTTPSYAATNVYHTLYLPTDWQPGRTYPVIVEYAPNGPFSDSYLDSTTGNVENMSLGYGITGGAGYIVIGMPTIGGSPLTNQMEWWGDLNASKDYCLQTVRYVCENYGGDPASVILGGFSRGAIACNYLGLNDDTIADAWLAFIPHSHYDGAIQWGYPNDDAASALTRLQRLKGRAQHVSHETWLTGTEDYLASTGVDLSAIRTRTLPFANHTDLWALRPLQLRRDVRSWLQQTLANRPGTHAISGRVTSATGVPIAGVRIQSGYTHFTFTAADGTYTLAGIIDSTRTISASGSGTFVDQGVTVAGNNLTNVNFQSSP